MVGRLKNHHESLKQTTSHTKTHNARGSKNTDSSRKTPEKDPDEQRERRDTIDLSKEAKHVMAWLQTAKNILTTLHARGDRDMIAQQCLLLLQGMRYLLTPDSDITSSLKLSSFFPLADTLLENLAQESVQQRSKEALPYDLTISHLHFNPEPEKNGYNIHALTFDMIEASKSHDENLLLAHDTFALPPSFEKPLASSSSELASLLQNTFINAHIEENIKKSSEISLQLIPTLPSFIVTHNQPTRPILLGGIALKHDNYQDPSVSLSL